MFGDASRPELLRKLRLDQARAVVLTMDHTAAAIHAVHGIRRMVPMMRIIARAREKHALLLREASASVVVPETLESSLKLTGWVLETLGIPPMPRYAWSSRNASGASSPCATPATPDRP